MRIMYFLQSLGKGGAERLILDICNELNHRVGIEYLLVSFSEVNDYKSLSQNIHYVVCNAEIQLSVFKSNKINTEQIQKIIADFKPDVIHSNVYLCELLTREFLFPNVRYFTHCHNNMPEFRTFDFRTVFNKNLLTKFYEKKRIEKKYLNCNNQFIAISNDTLDYYKKNLNPKLSKNIHLLHNAIEFEKFNNDKIRRIEDSVNLIMAGHMSDYKNQIFLINVLKILINKKINISLTLAGDWRNNGEKIIEKAKKENVGQNLYMPGMIEDIQNVYAEQHIYVHSAYYEPFGLVLIEAMASGLPVVCLDGGGNRDIIEEGKNGFMIEKPNAELFAEKIICLIENPDLYREMSEYARKFASKFDIKEYVDKLLGLYQSVL